MDWRRVSGYPLNEEPIMSDKTIMLNIEDLISLTFGPLETNVVNFSMMQTVLTILARQMRVLEDDIEIKFNDDQEKIMTLMHHLQEGSRGGSSESGDVTEKVIFTSKDELEGYITPDEAGHYVESKAKKRKREKGVKPAKDITGKDSGPSVKADYFSEIEVTKAKPTERAKIETPRTDDDDTDRSIDGRMDEPAKKSKARKKEKAKTELDRESSSLEGSEYSELKMEKRIEDKQKRKPRIGETVDDTPSFTEKRIEGTQKRKQKRGETVDDTPSLSKSEDVRYQKDKKESTVKKEKMSRKQEVDKQLSSSDESDDKEYLEKQSKGIKEKAPKKDKVSGHSKISDRSADTSSKKYGEGTDDITLQKRRSPEASSIAGRSDEVGDKKDKKTKDDAKSLPKKGQMSADISISGKSEDIGEKKDKKGRDDAQLQSKKEQTRADASTAEKSKDFVEGKVKKSKDESQKKALIPADSEDKSEDVRERQVKKSGDKLGPRPKQSKPRDSSVSDDSEESGDRITLKKGDDKAGPQSKKEKSSEGSAVSGKPQEVKGRKVEKSKGKKPQAEKGQTPEDSTVSDVSEDEIVSKHERSGDKRGHAKRTEDTESKKKVQSKESRIIPITSHISETERGGTRQDRKDTDEKIERTSKKGKSPTATSSTTGIIVSEAVRKGGKGPKDKILVVEKGPTTRASQPQIGKINVLPRPPFEALESDVQKIVKLAGPMSLPIMPLDQQFKEELASGAATLTGTMQAMQLNTRVKAAENALTRMADILTQLAIEGTLPPEARDLVAQLQEERKELSRIMSKVIPLQKKTSKTSLLPTRPQEGIDHDDLLELHPVMPIGKPAPVKKATQTSQRQRVEQSTEPSTFLVPPENPLVTKSNMSSAIENMKNEMLTQMTTMTAKSTQSAEQATSMARSIVERIEIAVAVSSRIEDLKKFTAVQSELLSGFSSGLTYQLKDFKSQLQLMRDELQKGLDHLLSRNTVESSAVTALRQQHDTIEQQMYETIHEQSTLVATNKQMHGELKNLKIWVELLRDEKADRKEVAIGLRDKVDINQLIGLLYEEEFEVSRKDLNRRLLACHETFMTNNSNWMSSLHGIRLAIRDKAPVLGLYSLKAYATAYLTEISTTLQKIESILGDPELAKLTRLISGDATCGACRIPALIVPFEKSYGLPPLMPVLPFEEVEEEEESVEMLRPVDTRKHLCKRWVGGSHTMFKSPPATVEKPQPLQLQEVPTRHYFGAGEDGAMYTMQEDLQGCVECNVMWKDELGDKPEVGGGDLGAKQSTGRDKKDADQGDDLDNLSAESTDRIIGFFDY